MARTKTKNLEYILNEDVANRKNLFIKKLNSEMFYQSDFSSDCMSFDWLDQIEFACSFLDPIYRNAKIALIKEEIIVNAERTKKVTVESIKDLSKHPNYVDKMDEKTGDVVPNRILNVINEETFNIYENRFLFTLLNDIDTFVYNKEEQLKNFKLSEHKSIEYSASTETDTEKVSIEMRVNSETFPSDKTDKKIRDEIKKAKIRIKRVKDYISSWKHSAMIKELTKAHVHYINPPIKVTNIFLKNPNFQVALKLYDYLQKYDRKDDEDKKNNIEKDADPLQGFLDHSFLIDFCVLDSISKSKREQKEKMSQYAIVLLKEEIHRVVSMLLNCGIEITDEQLLNLISNELKKEKSNRLVGAEDVKKKFRSAMDEYLERMQDYL